jgi:hypothetical protein
MKNEKMFNSLTQVAIPVLTLGGQVFTSMRIPQWGLILLLFAQPFWLYSSWKSYKQAGQIGIFINTVAFTVVTIFGVINYWLL